MDVKLSQIAVHYLTPPASSVGIERFFSTAADIITDDRGGIDPYKAEKVLFCHENLPLMSCEYEYTVFPPIRPVGLILSYFGNAGTISEQGSISVVTIS